MKIGKKHAMVLSFCLGAVMLVTTAFAEIVSKSGYDQLKDAVKLTAEACSEKFKSFTVEATITVKDNGNQLFLSNSTQKVDNVKKAMEDLSSSEYSNGEKYSSYYYRDKKSNIWYNSKSDTYYVTEFVNPDESMDRKLIDNPFEEDKFKDLEKIFDALVGDLKSHVVVDEKSDGSKEISGTLNEWQIPPLVNAIASFGFKNAFSSRTAREEMSMPEIKDDVFVKNVTGRSVVNKDGIIESVFAAGVLSGKDKDGKRHDLAFEVLMEIYDINSTAVSKPDLTGKKVEKNIEKLPERKISKKFIGKYKNDVVIEKDGAFVKIGERVVEIVEIDDKHISGRYYENCKEGYENYGVGKESFSFDAEDLEFQFADFEYTDSSGKKQEGSICFDTMSGKIYFNMETPPAVKGSGAVYDSNFSRVFD